MICVRKSSLLLPFILITLLLASCNEPDEVGLGVLPDNASESVGKKIRAAELYKIPYTIVLGTNEIESDEVTPRIRKDLSSDAPITAVKISDFLSTVRTEALDRAQESSF